MRASAASRAEAEIVVCVALGNPASLSELCLGTGELLPNVCQVASHVRGLCPDDELVGLCLGRGFEQPISQLCRQRHVVDGQRRLFGGAAGPFDPGDEEPGPLQQLPQARQCEES